MTIDEAIREACSSVGVYPPKGGYKVGKWQKTDTLSGKNGKGDGRVIVNDAFVTAWNWQTGEKASVGIKGELSLGQRRQIAKDIENERRARIQRAEKAASIAKRLVAAAKLSPHPYLFRKGLELEKALVCGADIVAELAGPSNSYLIPQGAQCAIVVPARIGDRVSSAQLIWEDGTKKFLYGGEMERACHRLASGSFTWFCDGFATGLSLRIALHSLNRRDCILCGFSAYNAAAMARAANGRRAIATDNDKPLPQFDGLGTGEHYARLSGVPYLMPPKLGDDLNDLHCRDGIFVVQRLVSKFLREAAM
ncbi:hypothetical protein [Kumtagia ephedrae]|uniref:Toprim domain-containing protein n=1 Tax=Kumtagia ephedrae TaxID=2116701 RepID=A0A2P7SPV1_9HYPH|nr:hypothetical protein [Mesorhizobium ephedrae]PSJ64488.1 hypothetical protein C7I84_05960 [Mesorhizobium ephedrae]